MLHVNLGPTQNILVKLCQPKLLSEIKLMRYLRLIEG